MTAGEYILAETILEYSRENKKRNSQKKIQKKGQNTDLMSTRQVIKYTILIPLAFYLLLRLFM